MLEVLILILVLSWLFRRRRPQAMPPTQVVIQIYFAHDRRRA